MHFSMQFLSVHVFLVVVEEPFHAHFSAAESQ